jgi:hypothetical protein
VLSQEKLGKLLTNWDKLVTLFMEDINWREAAYGLLLIKEAA